MRFSVLCAVAITALLGFAGTSANAAIFNFSSSDPGFAPLTKDNDVSAALGFATTDEFMQVDILTDSFADATLNGFDLTVAIFDTTTGELLGQSTDIDFDAGNYNDFLSVVVPTGNYSLYVSQYDNLAVGPNLSNGFLLTDPAFNNYTGGTFADLDGINRTGAWRLSVSTVAVPEAPSALLALPALTALAGVVIRRRALKGN